MFTNIGAVAAAILVVASGIGYELHHDSAISTPTNQSTTATAQTSDPRVIYQYAKYKVQYNDKTVPVYYNGKIVKSTYAYETSRPVHSVWQTDPISAAQELVSNLLPNAFKATSTTQVHSITDSSTDVVATYQGEQVSFHRVYLQNTTPKTSLVQVTIDSQNTIKTLNVYLYQLGHRYEWNIYKITQSQQFTPTSASTKYTNEQLAKMSPAQLSSYNMKNNKPLPFAGTSVTRDIPNPPINVSSPKAASIFGSTIQTSDQHFPANKFEVIDRWTGSIQGVNFDLEVDKKTDGSKFVVGIADGPKEHTYIFNSQPYITNFTGSYVVFATPNPAEGHPYYTLNLQTGSLTFSNTAYQMSNDYRAKSGASGLIVGLPKAYTCLPNN